MITDILLVMLLILNSVLLWERIPQFKRTIGMNKQLERDVYSARNDASASANLLRLARSDIAQLKGKIAGLEIELEASQKEAKHWEEIAKQRKRLLEMRGVNH